MKIEDKNLPMQLHLRIKYSEPRLEVSLTYYRLEDYLGHSKTFLELFDGCVLKLDREKMTVVLNFETLEGYLRCLISILTYATNLRTLIDNGINSDYIKSKKKRRYKNEKQKNKRK